MASIMRSGAIGGSIFFAIVLELIVVAEFPPIRANIETILEKPLSNLEPPAEAAVAPREESMIPTLRTSNPHSPPRQQERCGCFEQGQHVKYWGQPEKFCEPALGSRMAQYYSTQIANGQAVRMVLYQYDFLPDTVQLNLRGRAQLAKIAMWLSTNDFPVFVEPMAGGPKRDELRRQSVWTELSNTYIAIPNERVIVGRPTVRGLDADDALSVDRNRLGLASSRGVSSGSGGTSASSVTSNGSTGSTGQ